VIQPPSTVAVEQAVLAAPRIVSTLAVRVVTALSVWCAVPSGVTTPPQAMARAARLEADKYGFDEMMAAVMDPDAFDFRDMITVQQVASRCRDGRAPVLTVFLRTWNVQNRTLAIARCRA
jgi:hypothetical protein